MLKSQLLCSNCSVIERENDCHTLKFIPGFFILFDSRDAIDAERKSWRFKGNGMGVHWSKIDEDISV